MSLSLNQDIQKTYGRLIEAVSHIPTSKRHDKIIDGTGGIGLACLILLLIKLAGASA